MSFLREIIGLTGRQYRGDIKLDWEYTGDYLYNTGSSTNIVTGYSDRAWQNRAFIWSSTLERFWLFYTVSSILKYTSSTDGSTWETSSTIISLQNFSVKLINDVIHLVFQSNGSKATYMRGVPESDGSIIWGTPATIPTPPGLVYDNIYHEVDVSVDSDGYPWVTYNLLDGWWTPYPNVEYWGVVYTCVVKAANANGTAWGTASNIGGGEYNSYGTGVSIHRLNSGKMMMISNLGSGLGSYYKSSTSWTGIVISEQFAWEYGTSSLDCSIQSVSDKCKNIYLVWFGNGQTRTYHDGRYYYYPDKLYLSIFNTDRGTWTTTLLRTVGLGIPYVNNLSICYGSNGNIYIYYAKGSELCRVSILGCVDGNIGSMQPEVVVSTESSGIGQIECLEYATLNPYTGTQDVVLSFKVGTDFRYIVDRVIVLPEDMVETVEIYRHGSDEYYYTPLVNLSGPLLTYLDLNPPDDTLYYYTFRTQGESGAYSVFTKVNVPYDYLNPQIELSGRGGFNALRHAIYTTHNATDGDRDTVLIKLWEGDLTDASELESTSSPNVILTGDKRVETRNVEPFITDTFVTGSEVDAWKRIYSETSNTDKNVSARVRLKNGS